LKGSPTKVLYCESNVDGTIGGSHYCLLYLVEGLDRSQFEPTVLFYESHALIPRFQSVAQTVVQAPRMPVTWGSQSERRIFAMPLAFARRAVNLLKFARRVAHHIAFLKNNDIGLVHQNNSITRHRDWMCAALLAGVPCVASERGLNQKYTVVDRFYARHLALVIPMSRWIMDHMIHRKVSPANIRVMYDGINPSTIKVARSEETLQKEYNIRPGQPVIGIIGNIRQWKGQETVIRAMVEVSKAHPDVVCFVVGACTPADKPYMDGLFNLVKEARLEQNIRFTGYQSDPASFVNMMSIVIHASVQPEPFGMVVLEAMAQRKAVIGSRAGGVIEMVLEGKTGYTFPPGDATALAARVIELLSNPDRAKQMGEEGYTRVVSVFTLQRYINEVQTAYRAILGDHPLPSNIGIAATVTDIN
jgi:glycosyltransferase involved in cell wall biosynthesis